MIDEGFTLFTEEEVSQQRAAMDTYNAASAILYLDAESMPRNPTKIELLTEVIFDHLVDVKRVYPNDNGSLIFEELMPIDLGDQHWFYRAFVPTESGRVLNHIKFDDGMIGYYGTARGDSNGRLLSDPDGTLVRVPYVSRETVPLPRIQRKLLNQNLRALARKHS